MTQQLRPRTSDTPAEAAQSPTTPLAPQAFYEKLARRPDFQELMRRLAQITSTEARADGHR